MDWDEYFIALALQIARKSKDESTKIGCVFVNQDKTILATGFNGIPRGCRDYLKERHERPEKYLYFEHAERNAIYNAARTGISLKDSESYITAPPCIDCARGLIQVGIRRVIYPKHHPFLERKDWKINLEKSFSLLKEVGITVNNLL